MSASCNYQGVEAEHTQNWSPLSTFTSIVENLLWNDNIKEQAILGFFWVLRRSYIWRNWSRRRQWEAYQIANDEILGKVSPPRTCLGTHSALGAILNHTPVYCWYTRLSEP